MTVSSSRHGSATAVQPPSLLTPEQPPSGGDMPRRHGRASCRLLPWPRHHLAMGTWMK